MERWSEHFTLVGSSRVGNNRSKTTQRDNKVWEGWFDGRLLCIHSTVRLTGSNLAHFNVHSGARIGSHDWNLMGGHYVDLRVLSKDHLTADQLRRIGELARTEDRRAISVRQGSDTLDAAVMVPPPA